MLQPARFPAFAHCDHCQEYTSWPQWRRVEIGEYTALCKRCAAQQEQSFTPEQAILQAIVIIGVRQGINRTAVR